MTVYSTTILEQSGPSYETWVAPDTGQSVTVATSDPQPEDREVEFNISDEVAPPQDGVKIEAATYVVVTQKLNFRDAPTVTSDSHVIGYFQKGESIEVIGRTPDGEWALVGDQGVVVGYAAFTQGGKALLVTPEEAKAREAMKVSAIRARPTRMRAAAGAGSGKSHIQLAENDDVKTVKAVASTQCKTITLSQGKIKDNKSGCQAPNGKWAMA